MACLRSYSSDSAGVIMEEREGPMSESESESEGTVGRDGAGGDGRLEVEVWSFEGGAGP
jgi:hypothetical protein